MPKRLNGNELSDAIASKLNTKRAVDFTKLDLEEALHDAVAPPSSEFVVQKNGQARHAGASTPHGPFVAQLKARAERHLYVFSKTILKCGFLMAPLHVDLCNFIQDPRYDRECVLMPRETGKSLICAQATPLHISIQPKEHNCYFPGERGVDQRILLAGETIERIQQDALAKIMEYAETDDLLRALWPIFFDEPRRQSPKWSNEKGVVFNRPTDGPPGLSIAVVGVGAAIAGRHPSAFIKDDIFTFEAANSTTVADWTIEWHKASRGLINRPGCWELMDGTRWAIHDVYQHTIDNDPSVEMYIRSLVEEGKSIYPRHVWDGRIYGYDDEDILRLKKEFGVLFPLLYMNSASDPQLSDFNEAQLRYYEVIDDKIVIQEDARDLALAEIQTKGRQIRPKDGPDSFTGQKLTPDMLGIMQRRAEYLRFSQ